MFTPIKNFITYIQKNASGNSIFGGNSTTEEATKMETENVKNEREIETAATCTSTTLQSDCEIPKEIEDEDKIEVKVEIEEEIKKENEEIFEKLKDNLRTELKDSERNESTILSTSTVSTENSCGFEYEDVDDIEAQIESSIMLKKPVKSTATNGSEILEVKKSTNTNCSIVIGHDYNRNQALTPVDDELEDFRHDPTEVLGTNSLPFCNIQADEFCSVGSAEEVHERDATTADELQTEEEETEAEQNTLGEETELEEDAENEIETENEQKDVDDEDEEELFLDLHNFKSK